MSLITKISPRLATHSFPVFKNNYNPNYRIESLAATSIRPFITNKQENHFKYQKISTSPISTISAAQMLTKGSSGVLTLLAALAGLVLALYAKMTEASAKSLDTPDFISRYIVNIDPVEKHVHLEEQEVGSIPGFHFIRRSNENLKGNIRPGLDPVYVRGILSLRSGVGIFKDSLSYAFENVKGQMLGNKLTPVSWEHSISLEGASLDSLSIHNIEFSTEFARYSCKTTDREIILELQYLNTFSLRKN